MTRAEYLTKRGWIKSTGGAPDWYDPVNNRGADIATAVTIQLARDEEKAQAAWVAFAAVAVGQIGEAHVSSPGVGPGTVERWAAISADALLAEYRARFGAPATFTDEAT